MKSTISQLVSRILLPSVPQRPTIIGIDGPSGAGKSSLAQPLSSKLDDCLVIQFDDFYLPNDQLGSSSRSDHGWRFDWRRLRNQVLIPAREKTRIKYRKLDWNTGQLSQWEGFDPPSNLIVEGVYSLHIELRDYYDFSILVTAPYSVRLRRGVERDGETMRSMWVEEWMPEEYRYFDSPLSPGNAADVIVVGTTETDQSEEMIVTESL